MTDIPVFDDGTAPPAAGAGPRLEWRKIPGMVGLSFKIFFLRMLTMGIYYFWGKTETRRRIWSAVHLEGQPLEYTGKGMELFLGFLITMFLVFLPLFGMLIGLIFLGQRMFGPESPMAMVMAMVPFYIILFYLIGVAQYKARNYRLSRTNWRGIRGHMSGSAWKYGWTFFWTTIVAFLTLFWATPWQSTKLQRILTEETRFGEEPLKFTATAKPLYPTFAILWVGIAAMYGGLIYYMQQMQLKFMMAQMGVPLTSGDKWGLAAVIIGTILIYLVLVAIYASKAMNHFAGHTFIQNARFNLSSTPTSLIGLLVGNFLLTIFTLGIATPIVQARLARYFVERMGIEGGIDFDAIAQSQARLAKTGEGLAEAFDIDAF